VTEPGLQAGSPLTHLSDLRGFIAHDRPGHIQGLGFISDSALGEGRSAQKIRLHAAVSGHASSHTFQRRAASPQSMTVGTLMGRRVVLVAVFSRTTWSDSDTTSIELARRQDLDGQIEFVRGDFLTCPFQPASFGMITCVAALHHMDGAAALAAMSQLLVPGGTLVIVGVARSRLPDLPWEAAAVLANFGHRMANAYWE